MPVSVKILPLCFFLGQLISDLARVAMGLEAAVDVIARHRLQLMGHVVWLIIMAIICISTLTQVSKMTTITTISKLSIIRKHILHILSHVNCSTIHILYQMTPRFVSR